MTYSKSTYSILEKFDIDLKNGFLPKEDPLDRLPTKYKLWDELNDEMAKANRNKSFIQKIDSLPKLEVGELNKRELERAMLLLSGFAHSYVKESKSNSIPEQISIPWIAVADKMQRMPVIAHSELVLKNWRRKDAHQPFDLDNLETQISFTGTKTESWFFLVTTNIEMVGAKAIPLILESISLAKKEAYQEAASHLKKVIPILKDLLDALLKMYECCDPDIFFNEVRSFFDSFANVKYKGAIPEERSYHGGSAAQSSLLQFFDMGFGIDYGHNSSRDFLLEMRKYMPFPHRKFLSFIEQEYNLKEARKKDKTLDQICREIVALLIEFRNEHLKMVSRYIISPARKNQEPTTGTGGTNPLIFLKSIRNKNREQNEE